VAGPDLVPLEGYVEYPADEMRRRAREFRETMRRRRSVREFSDRPVPLEIIEDCVLAAASAPSGANRQPWHFAIVSDLSVKRRIREAAEREEQEFYARRAPQEWLEALAPLGTGADKPFLETAPHLIVVFLERYGRGHGARRLKHYYTPESVGIATGILIAALQHAGLACLTHTPSPMGFLREILGRPDNERAFMILVVGYPAPDARVPRIGHKPEKEVMTFVGHGGPEPQAD
jgi:nitroreductase